MLEQTLAGCPFCGAEPFAPEHTHKSGSGANWRIQCRIYCCSVNASTKTNAIRIWNKRKPSLSHIQDVEREKERLSEAVLRAVELAEYIGFKYDAYPNDHADFEDQAFVIERDFVEDAIARQPDGKVDLESYVWIETGEDGGVFKAPELAAFILKQQETETEREKESSEVKG